jgi:hypothetical protein
MSTESLRADRTANPPPDPPYVDALTITMIRSQSGAAAAAANTFGASTVSTRCVPNEQ